ncbi:polyphosphate polymerase domain-containing protein [Atopococcus tabaci]|uniref:polyphosphate polymerase domain-containing protein n=1 Tax=Atopococcus tabaci TaxID=269774 RepID=UPI0004053A4B|nr:polyphosphate polymerase domain-containing protein [Atopococcus tabaci]
MTETDKKYRNEMKYFCTDFDLDIVQSRLTPLVQLDPYTDEEYGNYVVRSLYFDDYDDNCLNHNEISIGRRKKYRIRYYGSQPDFLLLEKKEKENSMTHKTSCTINRNQYDQLYSGDVAALYWEAEDPLLKEFCLQIMMKRFAPKVIIHYERTAFIDFPGNVRVTMDRQISCSKELNRFLDGDYTRIPVLHAGQHLLEVKYDELLPDYIKQVVQLDSLEQATFSKYYMGRVTSQKHGGI